MVAGPRILSPGHASRLRLLDQSRMARREKARNRARNSLQRAVSSFLQDQPRVTRQEPPIINNMNLDDTGIYQRTLAGQWDGIVIEPPIVFEVGDYTKVARHCLSICFSYVIPPVLNHPSMASILFGKCLVHSLGGLDFECSVCKARAWKAEGRRIHPFVGKYCCHDGKIKLLPLNESPLELRELMQSSTTRSKNFLKNIRGYNNALAFASLGAHIDENISRGRGVYTFRVHGCIYHNIGSLMPVGEGNAIPRFAQLYFYDTEHELQNRMRHVPHLDIDVLHTLQAMMHRVNPYANALRAAANVMVDGCHNVSELTMVIAEARSNERQYLAPRGSEIAAILPGHGDERNIGSRDIVIKYQDGLLKRISNMHRSYMPLMYVLLFPSGEDGWHMELRKDNGKKISQQDYYSFRIQIRNDTNECLLRGGRLLQQYIVDAYCSIEDSRLLWLKLNQKKLRAEVYQGLADMVEARDGVDVVLGNSVGRRIVLPSSFTGGPRYMCQLYQDSMAIVRKRGKPDLFITFTCNPRWKEIEEALLPGQNASDRPDLIARVFYQKFRDLMCLLTKGAIFGDVVGHVCVIEFQKQGLPHAHILLILASGYKPTEVSHYDKLVCAELPNKELFPELYEVISRCNVHGPCGPLNPNAACMINGKCRFKYPRKFSTSTFVDESGYPTYMRRDNGVFVQTKDIKLDNRWVVPYSPFLSLRYKAHINVEICSTITAVKYLYKYVYKGHDRATVVLKEGEGSLDEIKSYVDARYVSASEAMWRIYSFDMHEEKPDVYRLQVHLPLQNVVTFQDSDDLEDVVNNGENRKTMLTEWFVINQNFPEANNLSYAEFPTKWVWNKSEKIWTKRQLGNSIGRMYNIVPTAGEVYYLRILLSICKGSKCFEELRTVDGQLYATFKEACNARGLLQDDEEWVMCLEEASSFQTGQQLRQLFAIILAFCEPLSPGTLWDRFAAELCDDYVLRLNLHIPDCLARLELAKNQALANVSGLLQQYGKKLSDYVGMPPIDSRVLSESGSTVLVEETMFDSVQQCRIAERMEISLNSGQRDAYTQVLHAIENNAGGVFFLDGPGGSGKTYLYNTLLSRIRGGGKVALACASSGIAALLLQNGRTAHSRFKIPLDLDSQSTCNIKVNSQLAELFKRTHLIIWDEAPMTHRYAFEAVDRTLRDILQQDSLFGGKVVLLGGDFRQVLPVVRKGTRADIVNASLCYSYIWEQTQILKLTQNMRVQNCLSDAIESKFSHWVLDIGNGDVHDGGIADNVIVPPSMLLERNNLSDLIEIIFGDLQQVRDHASFFRERGILAPRNKDVDMVNAYALQKMPGECREYLSADSLCESEDQNSLYTIEFLNSLDLGGGYPPHELHLKVNSPVMLLRNLDPKRGLCNGTRLVCKQFHRRVIEAEIITGSNIGERIFVPRIDFIAGISQGLPCMMRRRQFPIRLAFGMTVNKAQGQTLGFLGLYLATSLFSHGQLYVAMSRVRTSTAVKVLVDDDNQNGLAQIQNIVFKEVLQQANL